MRNRSEKTHRHPYGQQQHDSSSFPSKIFPGPSPVHLEAFPCNKDPRRVALMVKSHLTDEMMEIKPLLHLSESVFYHNWRASHDFHSADEETGGPMAGNSMCVGTRLLTYKRSKSTSTCSICFHCPDLQGSKRKHGAPSACRVATEGTGDANSESGPSGWGF